MRIPSLVALVSLPLHAAAQGDVPPPRAAALARAAAEARPLDCAAAEKAFAELSRQGRQPGDVEAVVIARRADVPCAVAAANAAATALRIPPGEIVEWLMRHPEAVVATAPTALPEEAPALGRKLDCGLTYVGSRLVSRPDGMRLVLEFENRTGKTILGRDLSGRIGGQPWRSTIRLGSDISAPPLGSADMLEWDSTTGRWEDRRSVESRRLRLKRDDKAEAGAPVPPGAAFEEWVSVTVSSTARAEDIPVEIEACRLRLE